MSFTNKVVIVTGASSGIGAATAISFSKEGANVVLVGRNQDKIKKVFKECEKFGKKNILLIADISKDDDAKRVINTTIENFGKLDVLVNNAGVVRFANIVDEHLMAAYDEVINTNVRAPVYLTNLSAQYLIKTKGNVINVSSVAATDLPSPSVHCYSLSKAALNQFTRSIAAELGAYGIRVNTISPGPVKTDLSRNAGVDTPIDENNIKTLLGRVSESQEVADLILYVASDKAIGITGSDFVCDNGWKLRYLHSAFNT